MEKFEGFTDEDIKNLTLQKNTNSDEKLVQNNAVSGNAVYKHQQNKSRYQNRLPRKNVARERLLKGNLLNSNSETLPKEALLCIQQIPEEEEDERDSENLDAKQKASSFLNDTKIHDDRKLQTKNQNHTTETSLQSVKNVDVGKNHSDGRNVFGDSEEEAQINASVRILNSDGADVTLLEEFEHRQKLMEEQNRQRKELLRQALKVRTKKTHEEVKRLNAIEGELKKLDLLLSSDVAIIRDQIEAASFDFMEAQKRYDKAEKEFLDSKLDLFNKKEKKELLTGHLCTIIEQNEMRKAKKLSDLMLQLEVGPKSSLIMSQIKVEYKPENNRQHNEQNNSDAQEDKIKEIEQSKKENLPDS